ncbi:dihydrolipoamide dehydrogenase [Kiloniella litopenaei]|uniref:Dihydrolipoamide dehydrogenase n=1 Tax=Kiloniella litopenaei TaxID=1549748 RepID=A0A0M2RE76_9PROT|nr:FAD-dependent oxidoreductase [Kiloniella litopenaei]KKJ77863.1 dihydrolipoamide dehydrogenase [Kiloniella litopenaei]
MGNNTIKTDICVIGGGSAGLSIAAGAVQMGADTVLVEAGKMGGDCLNYGCVPSKALLTAGKVARTWKKSSQFGVTYTKPEVDFHKVHDHVKAVIADIEPHDSVERFESLGVTVIQAPGAFVDGKTLKAGDVTIQARRFVIATGSRAMIPPIEGIGDVPFLTNESVFDLTDLPKKIIIVGGGPIGCELGQAFRNLGSEVSIVEMATIMPKDDPELVSVIRNRLEDDGISFLEQTKVLAARKSSEGVSLRVEVNGKEREIAGTHLLLAAGRVPNLEKLNLEAAGIRYERQGINVDKGLRTSNRKVYAAGDVTGGYQFTHMAAYDAGIIIRNALFRLPAKVSYNAVPWVTYTDPELAHVGLSEADAKKQKIEHKILNWSFADNDRARAERRTEGKIKVITTLKGKILGASIVGLQAGELILPWGLALSKGLKIGDMANVIAPYPTLSEVSKRVAGSYYTESLFSDRVKKVVRFLVKFG